MTNIEKIKQARQDLVCLLTELGQRAEKRQRISKLQFDAMQVLFEDFAYAQAEALRQATEVADENFARAQKLSEQVQENVRHIERLAGERGEVFTAVVDALEALYDDYKALADSGDAGCWALEDQEAGKKALAALALAKGEAV